MGHRGKSDGHATGIEESDSSTVEIIVACMMSYIQAKHVTSADNAVFIVLLLPFTALYFFRYSV